MFIFKKVRLFFWIKYIKLLEKFKIHKKYPVHYIGGSEALPPPLSSDEES